MACAAVTFTQPRRLIQLVKFDFNDPASIVAWYRVHPARHGPMLAALARIQPRWKEPIRLAGELLRATRGQRQR
jgi:hypothetical protein